jgi:hypothetical protein
MKVPSLVIGLFLGLALASSGAESAAPFPLLGTLGSHTRKITTESAEAEQVYRDDLQRLPENGWSLFGLSESLALQGKNAQAAPVRARFAQMWRRADVTIRSSCFCQPGA